jgi:zinc and cadmium transporter
MIQLFLASILVMLASLIGVVFVWRHLGQMIEKNLHFLTSLAAGVFLMVAFQLAVEALEHTVEPMFGWLWIGLGILIWWLFFNFLPDFHHHCQPEAEKKSLVGIDARRVLTGDAVHNIGDGILLASAFMINPTLGWVTTISVFIHELVQETSEFFVLRQAGFSIKKTLILNFIISGSILIGAFGSFFLFHNFLVFEMPILGLAAGAFLVVALFDLIPHSARSVTDRSDYLKHLGWFLVGVIMMLGVNVVFVHSHDHGDESGHSDHQVENH